MARHDSRPYVLVEDFEEMLAEVKCSTKQPSSPTTQITMRFRDPAFVDMAREAWLQKDALIFITHHPSCNEDFEERAPYT